MIDCKSLDYLLSFRLGQDFELSHFYFLNSSSISSSGWLAWSVNTVLWWLAWSWNSCFGETLHLYQFDRHSGCKIICRISIKSCLHGERQIDNWRVWLQPNQNPAQATLLVTRAGFVDYGSLRMACRGFHDKWLKDKVIYHKLDRSLVPINISASWADILSAQALHIQNWFWEVD